MIIKKEHIQEAIQTLKDANIPDSSPIPLLPAEYDFLKAQGVNMNIYFKMEAKVPLK